MPIDEALRRSAAHVMVSSVSDPELTEEEFRHLSSVLRLRDGETVTVTDGCGHWATCVWHNERLEPVGSVQFEERSCVRSIGVVIPKGDRPEWIVQKLVEIGIDRVVFLESERSVVRWAGARSERHIERLRRVADAACGQSRRVWRVDIDGPLLARDVLHDFVVAEPGGRSLHNDDVSVAIGPEGGWTDEELALSAGRVDLGNSILRVETAALVAAAHMMAGSR